MVIIVIVIIIIVIVVVILIIIVIIIFAIIVIIVIVVIITKHCPRLIRYSYIFQHLPTWSVVIVIIAHSDHHQLHPLVVSATATTSW